MSTRQGGFSVRSTQVNEFDIKVVVTRHPASAARTGGSFSAGGDLDSQPSWPVERAPFGGPVASVLSGCSAHEFGVGDVGAITAEPFKDFVGGFVPDERFRVFVPVVDPVDDVFGERSDGVVG